MVTLTFADRMQKRLLRPIVPKVLKFPPPKHGGCRPHVS